MEVRVIFIETENNTVIGNHVQSWPISDVSAVYNVAQRKFGQYVGRVYANIEARKLAKSVMYESALPIGWIFESVSKESKQPYRTQVIPLKTKGF